MTYLFLLLINYMSGMTLHAFHVSVTDIVYDDKKKQLEITHRIFLDDLEFGLTNWSNEQVDVLSPSDADYLDQMIGEYLTEKTSYMLNGKSVKASYLGSEKEESVMYCYQVIGDVKKVKSLKIANTVFMETYDDQTNIINIACNKETRSLKLSNSSREGEVLFN